MPASIFNRLAAVPPRRLPRAVLGALRRRTESFLRRLRDRRGSTFARAAAFALCPCPRADVPFAGMVSETRRTLESLAVAYLAHRFDLLGSGWVGVNRRKPPGIESDINPANRVEARRIRALLDDDYTPIDWQADFKSGYHWSARTWYRDVRYGDRPGVDVKVPWELARMQHLPQLALAFGGIRCAGAPPLQPRRGDSSPRPPHCVPTRQSVAAPTPGDEAESPAPPADWRVGTQPAPAGGAGAARVRGVEEQPDAEREPEKCADRYPREFRNQVLDFIAANPPRFGVNWACTMDVGIRVANWLVAYNLFRAAGAEFDAEFEAVFARSVYEHAQHIADNLEWTPALAANHYLANIAGLLFAAAHLPRSPRTDAWLGFGAQELVGAVRKQFYEDGTNFEASNGYHRLAAEMVVYTTALVLGLPPERLAALREYDHRLHTVQPPLPPAPVEFYRVPGAGRESPFPEWYFERLQRMAQFVVDTTRQSSHIPQFGDNDSGRFLKLVPAGALPQTPVRQAQGFQPPKGEFPFGVPLGAQNGCAGPNDDGRPAMAAPAGAAPGSQGLWPAWAEDVLDHRHLVAAVNGLFAREDFAAFAGPRYRTETEVVRWLAGGVIVQAAVSAAEPAPDSASGAAAAPSVPGKAAAQGEDRVATGLAREDGCRIINVLPRAPSQSVQLELDRPSVSAYPDFGLWVYRSPRCYLAVRCGGVGQNGNGGHAHNDQLAFVFGLDGRSLIVDRGTAFYTPAPEQRNLFRSTVMHNTLTLDGHEQNPWASGAPGLFTLHDHAHAHPVTVTDTEFIGEHRGFGVTTSRRLEFRMDRVLAVDTCEHPGAKTVSFHLAPGIDARHIGGDTVEIVLQDRGICWLNGDGFWAIEDCPHSSAYGVVQPARTCRLRSAETEIAWAINWG